MKKQTLLAAILLSAVLLPFLGACSKDTPQPIKRTEIKNPALATLLKAKGYTLEGAMLVMNEKAMTTTALDLSGTKLTDVSGLEVFPKLEEVNLADNGLGPAFDFAPLPATVKRINLAGNEIYDYLNLAATDYDKGEYSLIRPLDKLTLPATAKYNMDALPAFMKTAPKCDMQMITCGDGDVCKLEKYTTLREVPDPIMLKQLKNVYPSVFMGDKIDIQKPLNLQESQNSLVITQKFEHPFDKTTMPANIEGAEYIINHPLFSASVMLQLYKEQTTTLPYLNIPKKLQVLYIVNVNTPYINYTNMEKVFNFQTWHNQSITNIDLRKSAVTKQANEITNFLPDANRIVIVDCPKLTEIKMPETEGGKGIYGIKLVALPELKAFDMSKIEILDNIALAGIQKCNPLKLPEIKRFAHGQKIILPDDPKYKKARFSLAISADVWERPEVKDFIKKYGKIRKIRPVGDYGDGDEQSNLNYFREEFNVEIDGGVNWFNYKEWSHNL